MTEPVEVLAPGLAARHAPTAAELRAVQRSIATAAHEAAALPAEALRDVLPVLAQAERETQRALARWLASVPDAGARYTAQHHRAVLAHLDGVFEKLADLYPAMVGGLVRTSRRAGQLAVSHMIQEVARMSSIFDGTLIDPPIRLAGILAHGDRVLIPRFRTSAARYAGDITRDIRQSLAVGLVRGETVSALVDRLVAHGGPRGAVALRGVAGEPGAVTEDIAEGLFRRYRYWSERVVRTEVQNAYNEAKEESYDEAAEEIPDLCRRWDSSLDLRTCVRCGGLHGEVRPLREPFSDGSMSPPAHPNCRCTTVPWRENWPALGIL